MSGRGVGEIMRIRYLGQLFAIFFLAIAGAAAQNPAQPRAEIPLQIPNPHYATIEESIVVDAPVDKVWRRVGKFCDITEWMKSPEWADCKYLQGDGGPGTVRSIVNVGQTQYSYTYAQAPRKDTLYHLAHGTLSAEALTPTTTQLTYTMLRDDSMLSDDGTRTRGLESRKALVAGWLKNMKLLAEGGQLSPKPPGSLRPPNTTPFLNPDPQYASLPMSIVVDPRLCETCMAATHCPRCLKPEQAVWRLPPGMATPPFPRAAVRDESKCVLLSTESGD